MPVYNYRLPIPIEANAESVRQRRTSVISNKAGFESRNRDWVQRRGRWNLAAAIQDANDILIIRDLHDLVGGRADGWLFVDVSDDKIGDPAAPASLFQTIGVGDGIETTFVFTKVVEIVGSGIPSYSHRIFKPLTGTVSILLDGVVQGSGFTIDYDFGRVIFDTAPAAAEVVGLACEHAYPVRFESDDLAVNLDTFTDNAGEIDLAGIDDINIVELRLREPAP